MEEFIKKVREHYAGIYETEIKKKLGNNGVVYTGLLIKVPENPVKPVIYLNAYYQAYQTGRSFGKIIEEMDADIEKVKSQEPFNADILLDFSNIKDKLRISVINQEWNKELLKTRVHRAICDLAIVYTVDMGDHLASTHSGRPVINVTKDDLRIWEVTEEDLYRNAIENMKKFGNFQVMPLDDLLTVVYKRKLEDRTHAQVVTDISGGYPGTAGLSDISFLTRLSEGLGGSFYIFPSSIYELLLLPVRYYDEIYDLNEFLVKMNRNTAKREECLSDHIYLFDADTKELKIVVEGDRNE